MTERAVHALGTSNGYYSEGVDFHLHATGETGEED